MMVCGTDLSNGGTDDEKLDSPEISMIRWTRGFASKEKLQSPVNSCK